MRTITKLDLGLVLVALRSRAEVLDALDSWVSKDRAEDYRAFIARMERDATTSQSKGLRTGEAEL